jgi:hypothetical protein
MKNKHRCASKVEGVAKARSAECRGCALTCGLNARTWGRGGESLTEAAGFVDSLRSPLQEEKVLQPCNALALAPQTRGRYQTYKRNRESV